LASKQEVRHRIEELGIIPAIRVSSAEDALFAAKAVFDAGIPLVEVATTMPEAHKVIAQLVQSLPGVIVGAGGIQNFEMAGLCLNAGAMFLASDGFDPKLVGFAIEEDVLMIPGALTPSEVLNAWKLGPDFVKVAPCSHIGGPNYFGSLKVMFPAIALIAAGGVTQQTAAHFVRAGASALGIGTELLPREAIATRQANRIGELARRFVAIIGSAREQVR